MSPIVARAATRAATRRQFSMLRSMRSFARSFEPHPFERMPVTQTAQAADWGRQAKRLGKQAAIFIPGMTFVLGWPYLGNKMLDGNMGVW